MDEQWATIYPCRPRTEPAKGPSSTHLRPPCELRKGLTGAHSGLLNWPPMDTLAGRMNVSILIQSKWIFAHQAEQILNPLPKKCTRLFCAAIKNQEYVSWLCAHHFSISESKARQAGAMRGHGRQDMTGQLLSEGGGQQAVDNVCV